MSDYIVTCDEETAGWIGNDADSMLLIVRCKDCSHYTDDEMEYYHYCNSWCEQVKPDGYCAWGKRRSDAE